MRKRWQISSSTCHDEQFRRSNSVALSYCPSLTYLQRLLPSSFCNFIITSSNSFRFSIASALTAVRLDQQALHLPQPAASILLAPAPPVKSQATAAAAAGTATQRCLPMCHSLQQAALLLQRCALELSCVPLTGRPVPLHACAVHPSLQLLALLAGAAVGRHSCRSLGLGLQGLAGEAAKEGTLPQSHWRCRIRCIGSRCGS